MRKASTHSHMITHTLARTHTHTHTHKHTHALALAAPCMLTNMGCRSGSACMLDVT
jgi:hypothetical protein